ncbi:hypothetical protein LX86_002032 [Lentzea aerocolonigenes]|nr:hypothetical protein [Lentzea aerocolonigenes]
MIVVYVTDPPCPNCGHRGVIVTRRLRVTGPAVLAGASIKMSADEIYGWRCGVCGGYGTAHTPPGFVYREDDDTATAGLIRPDAATPVAGNDGAGTPDYEA